MPERRFLAFDLGAESGRAVVGTLSDDRLETEEIHRFLNEPVEVHDTRYWDILALYNNLLKGMRAYVARHGENVDGIGIDTWAIDFGLLGEDGHLLENPIMYRDRRTEGMVEEAAKKMPPERLAEITGLAVFAIHTFFQMLSLRLKRKAFLDTARTYLMIPDLLGYFLTGEKVCERSNAITTQLYDPRLGDWSREIFETFDLPLDIMPPIVDPGTVLGELRESVCRAVGLREALVIDGCTHDTGAAVAAVPARGDNWAFISSGTWSIVGSLSDCVVTGPGPYAARTCNELTFGSLILVRNIMGLWLLQQARAAWARQGQEYTYAELAALAEQAPAGGPIVYPDDPIFLAPDDMTAAIAQFCVRTGQAPPEGVPATCRCILESLALCYRQALEQIGSFLGRQYEVLHIVGGGSQNRPLCQFTADATGLPVYAGPAEATVAGNILVQACARGYLSGPQDVREVVRNSTQLVEHTPRQQAYWDDRYALYLAIYEKSRS